ncbi:MAG: TIGR01777 family oxidoreductase, partial [Bdellovibrionales bacterium]|nr:TIGR01777 family oxidoreductase [Bdellovibrionales bacterium]
SVFICASAIGYYGSRDQMLLSEEAEPGTGFLADVTKAWEQAAKPADQAGIRTVNLRTGIVLSRQGGALKKMLLPFLLGAGGIIGSGEQYMSWIELDDQIRAILHLLDNTQISGPVNLVSPNPVTNREFTKTLGMVLKRPAFFAVPEFAVRLAFGEMGEETILSSAHVSSKKLQESGFSFDHPGLEDALRHALAA